MKRKGTKTSKSRSLNSLPAKSVRRTTSEGVRGGYTGTTRAHSDDGPTESITFVYGKLGVKYTPPGN